MRRTQIYLSEEIGRALARMAKASRVTKSQLIRQALEQVYLRKPERTALLRALDASAGAWRRRQSGEAFVERARRGRLAKMHADRT